MFSVNPHQRKGKGGKGRKTYKFNINFFSNNTNNPNNITNKRNNVKYTKLILNFPELGVRALASRQQLPGSTRNSRTGFSSRQELDSGRTDRNLYQDCR